MDKTVTEIVQGLLDKGYISAKEATTLLKAEIEANQSKSGLFKYPFTPQPITYPLDNQPYYTTSTDPIECNKQQING
jgi:hypothetical protein